MQEDSLIKFSTKVPSRVFPTVSHMQPCSSAVKLDIHFWKQVRACFCSKATKVIMFMRTDRCSRMWLFFFGVYYVPSFFLVFSTIRNSHDMKSKLHDKRSVRDTASALGFCILLNNRFSFSSSPFPCCFAPGCHCRKKPSKLGEKVFRVALSCDRALNITAWQVLLMHLLRWDFQPSQ